MMKTKYILSYFSLLLIAIACQKGEGETVETANILRPQADIPYTFSRNGQSSVDEHSVSLLREPLEIIERRLLNGAISNFTYDEILRSCDRGCDRFGRRAPCTQGRRAPHGKFGEDPALRH